VSVAVVIPSAGRPTLGALVARLGGLEVVLVDDRRDASVPLLDPVPDGVRIVRGPVRGPAAARNAGMRACATEWVAFLDDDVEPADGWADALTRDLADAAADVGGVQGRIAVPLPGDRRPTDWERNTQGLETARWATADLAYRRAVLDAVGGFDERFPRAYREDADLGLRVTAAGRRIVTGKRLVRHPVRPAPAWVSLAKQAGNADDVLMRRLHGRGWRERAGVPRGRRPHHLATAGAGGVALVLLAAGRRRAAAVAGGAWLAGTAELAWARIALGPRTRGEVVTMAWTSALMPFAATGWWLAGHARRRPADRPAAPASRPAAVLFDRDGTLIEDVPYNGDPARVELAAGAREAVARLRAAGVPTGVVSNQSGVARGLIGEDDVRAVNARVEELLGAPLGPVAYCPHGPDDGCGCRKPAPGLIRQAAARLGVDPARCVVIGDIGADVDAARAAGARGILVPTGATRAEEIAAADEVAPDLVAAVERALGGVAA
jgi:histidinol-phosphate phosphatase family protein